MRIFDSDMNQEFERKILTENFVLMCKLSSARSISSSNKFVKRQ